MSTSTLDPENINEPDRIVGKGHGTGALGPSDSSDSGSDVAGGAVEPDNGFGGLGGIAPGDMALDQDWRRNEVDSDTDSSGTGERASVEQDSGFRDGQDIGIDRIERIVPDGLLDDGTLETLPEEEDEPDKRVAKMP